MLCICAKYILNDVYRFFVDLYKYFYNFVCNAYFNYFQNLFRFHKQMINNSEPSLEL